MAGFKGRIKSFIKYLFILSILITEVIVIYLAYQVYLLYKNPIISQNYNVSYQNYKDMDPRKLANRGPIDFILYRSDPINGYQIFKRNGLTPKNLITLSKYDKELIVRHGDTLFYPKDGLLFSMDVNTLLEKPVFDISTYYQGEPNVFVTPRLVDLKVIENTIYASYGGFALDPGTYWVDPNTLAVGKLSASRNASIKKINDTYWLEGGEGDGGGVIADLILFDPIRKAVIKDFEFISYFMVGEYVLEFNETEGYLIVAGSKEDSYLGGNPFVPEEVYEYVKIFSPPIYDEEILINFVEEYETDILDLAYDKGSRTLYFSSDLALYTYNINERTTEKLLDYSKTVTSPSLEIRDTKVCVKDSEKDKEYLVDIHEKTIEEVFYCDLPETTTGMEVTEKVEFSQIFESLNLPEGFDFEVLQ